MSTDSTQRMGGTRDMTTGSIIGQIVLFALPLMLRDLPWRWRMPKWLGYAIYPAHLALLWLLEQWI